VSSETADRVLDEERRAGGRAHRLLSRVLGDLPEHQPLGRDVDQRQLGHDLVDHALTKKKLFRGRRLMPKSPEILAIVAALARGWRDDKLAAEVLRRAQSSGDAEMRAAAQLGREPT